jgi:hypothetical protein
MCLLILGEDASNRRDISGVMPYAEQALAAGPHNSGPQLRMAEALLWRVTVRLPKISSVQVMRHVGTRGGCHRGVRAGVC